ncbi:MAG: nucleotidyltransferase [Spirochaetales bacterium]|nr:nucleotidyltransferase [Spirochaetales bacterium]
MLYNHNEIKKIYKSDYQIKKAISDGKLYKLDKGVYADKEYINPLVIFSKKYPRAIATMDTAFYYYDLTDVIPQKTILATPGNYRKIVNENIIQVYVPNDIFLQGKDTAEISGERVNIYDRERLLVELIRKRNKMPFDYYKEIISNYRKITDNLDMYKIEDYLSLYKNDEKISDILMREVF